MTGQDRPGTADDVRFTELALASPGLWRTVSLVRSFRGEDHRAAVRAWIRRPDALRVEELDGRLVEASVRTPGPATAALTAAVDAAPPPAGDRAVPPRPAQPVQEAPRPQGTPDGIGWPISRRRPEAPFFQDYHWVAMLDPYELAVGADLETGAEPPPLAFEEVGDVAHHGRPALQALVRTLPGYDPRCDCCPLLPGLHSETRSVEAGGGRVSDQHPGWEHAEAHVVRLDVGTGICVYTEQVGGSWHGRGHDVVVEAVDEDLPDDMFVSPPSGLRRLLRRRP